MTDLKFTKEHEWARVEGDVVTIGITDHAAEALGDLVYVELPEVGDEFEKGDAAIVVESSKSASDVYTPVAGRVVEINESLNDAPENVNNSTYDDGWLIKVKSDDLSPLDELLSKSEYKKYLEEEDQ